MSETKLSERIHAVVEELRLLNFRAFGRARLRFSDLTFLVGRNGAGKSSILDAVALLREAVTDNLENALDRRGGLLKVRCRSHREPAGSLGVAVVFRLRLPGGRRTRAIYGFELLGEAGTASYQVRECLKLYPEGASFFERRDDQFEAAQRTGVAPPPGNLVLPLIGRSDSVWEAVYEAARRMRTYDLLPGAMAESSKIGPGTYLESDGTNAGDALKAVEGTPDHRWVDEHLAALTPGLEHVRTEVVLGRRVLTFTQVQNDVGLDYDASQMSQGTLRSLGILLAMRQQPTPSLVLVDEVENSVHPSALGVLLDAAQASKDRVPIVFTTHSPEVLDHRAATGERIRVVEWRDGTSVVYRLNAETASAVSEIETVGSMLRSNMLWPEDQPGTWTDDLFALEGSDG
ncbi:MAG TPA: AAA family ATPase [Thermoanaerobaculia bacterium]|jgi:predicted ATPase